MLNHGTLVAAAVSSVRLRYSGVMIQDTSVYTGIPYDKYVIIWKIRFMSPMPEIEKNKQFSIRINLSR